MLGVAEFSVGPALGSIVFPMTMLIFPAGMLSYAEMLGEVSCEVVKGVAQVLGCPTGLYVCGPVLLPGSW